MNEETDSTAPSIGSGNACLTYTPTLREKIGRKLFPPGWHNYPEPDFPVKDCLVCDTVTDFSFVDRVRILFSGRVYTRTRTDTENEIGKHVTAATVIIRPPACLIRKE